MTIEEITDKIKASEVLTEYYPTKQIAKSIMEYLPDDLQASLDPDTLARIGVSLSRAERIGFWNAKRLSA